MLNKNMPSDTECEAIMKTLDKNIMVAHYTTMEGLHGLLQHSTGTGKHLQLNFWASNIFAMNDPNELMYGYDVIWKWLPEIEKNLKTPNRFRLSNIWKLSSPNDEQNYNEILKESLYKHKEMPYLISFSHSIDSLPMFRWYSNDGQGVSIVFSYGELKENDIHLYKVMYNPEKKTSDYTSYDMVNTVYKMYVKAITRNNDRDKTFSIMLEYLTLLSLVVAPFIKTSDYNNEREIRFSKLNKLNDNVLYRLSKNGNIIPYIIQKIPINTIDRIIIGPCADYLTTKRMIELELLSKGVDWIPIEKSKTSYRRY